MRADIQFFREMGIKVYDPEPDEHRGRALFWVLALPIVFWVDWLALKLIVKAVIAWLT